MGTHIIVTGNPVDGFSFYGLYATRDEAIEAAEKAKLEDNWWIAKLDSPMMLED